ncbi:MAG: shikimate dehydrogenase [Paludibacteraceae bacterium]|nr:shikimate dehydrogenase [Paludibacteraceae bacterium]
MFGKRKKQQIDRLYGIIGRPLVHSYSKAFFSEKFADHKNLAYENFELASIDEFPGLIESHPNLCGLNVTIPYQRDVMRFLDEIDPTAAKIGAVNVVKIERRDGKPYLKGYNTDYYGFKRALEPMLKDQRQALVLGTGGASKAVIAALDDLGIGYRYVSRTAAEGRFTYEDLNREILQQYPIIINTTPLGTFPNVKECADIPYEFITDKHVCFDLIYNPIRTLFLNQAELKGAAIKNGWEMFVYQALKTYEIWEGVVMTHNF